MQSIPFQIQWFDTLDSTSNLAKDLAKAGAPAGTVIAAGSQTGGRGRRGHSFLSPAGTGMYLSVILRPEKPVEMCMHLTCAVAVAVARAIEKTCGVQPGIKWPNDLTWQNKKLGGILTEISAENGKLSWAVVGIGLNCAAPEGGFPPDLEEIATSLRAACGRCVDREELLDAVVRELEMLNSTLFSGKDRWMTEYRQRCVTLGRPVQVLGDEIRAGFAEGVTDDGALAVSYPDGSRENVNSGEVSVRGMYGYL